MVSIFQGWTGRFALLTASSLGLFLVLAFLGHPGAPSACLKVSCWCEEATGGWGREPLNTWSNLFVFACSIFVASRLDGRPGQPRPVGLERRVLLAFSYALWLQASGALYFHGSLTTWTRAFDSSSVLMVHGILVCTGLLRWGILPQRAFVPILIGATFLPLVYRAWLGLPIDPIGLAALFTTLGIEARLSRKRPKRSLLLHLALLIMTLSFVAWGAAQPGKPLCGVFPGHALWHVGMGLAVTLFGLHAASDVRRATA